MSIRLEWSSCRFVSKIDPQSAIASERSNLVSHHRDRFAGGVPHNDMEEKLHDLLVIRQDRLWQATTQGGLIPDESKGMTR